MTANSVSSRSVNRSRIRHLLLANPENRRVTHFQQALQKQELQPAEVLSWTDFLADPSILSERLDDHVLRIESPGENHQVERALIARGWNSTDSVAEDIRVDSETAQSLKLDHGRIRYMEQWYKGFSKVLTLIQNQLPASTPLYNHPRDIALMFDKAACHKALQQVGAPVIDSFGSAPENLDEILATMSQRNWNRVFIKPAHGSSASGVIALTRRASKLQAITTIEIDRTDSGTPRFYNNLKLQSCSSHSEVSEVVDFICQQNAHVEQWLPKATQDGSNFDLRILVVGGRACHAVVRTSKHPITNLHLGNRRGELDSLMQQAGEQRWTRIISAAEQAAKVAPDSIAIGVDLLLTPGRLEPKFIELNAFGDLLPGVQWNGRDVWETQIESMLSKVTSRIIEA